MRVWVDLTNTAHVLVLRPLVELLERDGHEVTLTARPLSHTVRAARGLGPSAHGDRPPRRREPRRQGARRRRPRSGARSLRARPRASTARSRTARPTCHRPAALLRIPNTTMFDYEWASLQHHVNCRLANRVLVPDAIPAERLARYGARPPKLVQLPGAEGGVLPGGLRARRLACSTTLGRRSRAAALRRSHGAVVRALPARLRERAAAAAADAPRTSSQRHPDGRADAHAPSSARRSPRSASTD